MAAEGGAQKEVSLAPVGKLPLTRHWSTYKTLVLQGTGT